MNSPAAQTQSRIHQSFGTIGLERIRIGSLLCALYDTGEWRQLTNAKSWRSYVTDEEGIEWHAATQYMQVARRFVLDLGVAEAILRRISRASMRALVEASRVVDRHNLEEIVTLLETLPRVEAIQTFKEMARNEPEYRRIQVRDALEGLRGGPDVARILRAIDKLPMELKTEVHVLLNGNASPMKRVCAEKVRT